VSSNPPQNGNGQNPGAPARAAAAPPQVQANQRAEPPRPPLTPRSPREALAPQRVPAPARSRRVRHPLVIAGNALFTLLVLLAVGCGAAIYFG
jgi:hypothetical protein